MQKNSFDTPISQMHFGMYQPQDVESALDRAEALAWKRINTAISIPSGKRTFANTVLAITRATEEFNYVIILVEHQQYVLGGPWTKPNDLATERSTKLSNKLSMHEGIYKALLSIRELNGSSIELDAAETKLLNDQITDFERNGIKLQEKEKEKLNNIRSKLSKLRNKFGQNVVKASDEAGLYVADSSGMTGLSKEFIDKARETAKKDGKKGYWISYNQPTYGYVMSTCAVRKTRQDMFETHIQRAADTNEAVAKKILGLRQEMAQILGYRDYADYALERRMAKSGDAAYVFISDLTEKYRPKMQEEFTELQTFARKLENDNRLHLDASDVDTGLNFYYSSKLMLKSIGIDEDQLKSYFNLKKVLEVMFETLHALYGVGFVKSERPTWHPDVEVYDIRENNITLATVYCDWFARKGKRAGAWANVFYNADRAVGTELLPHLGCVVTNLDEPNTQGVSHLTMRDVETVWHEFGHFMHVTFSAPKLKEHWAFGSKWDFVEAPSQIMENWVWQPYIIKKLAIHERTGKSLSDGVIHKLSNGRAFQVGLKAMRQLCQATIDLSLHRDHDKALKAGVIEYSKQLKKNFLPVEVHPKEAFIASFSHIFSGGYAAGYYSYKWAEAIEADLFSRFAEEGILNARTGFSYRQEVLAKGSELDPDVLISNFLQRGPNPNAMLIRDGVVKRED